jgi:hypothetical protein
MNLKDYVYDSEAKTVTLWLKNVERVQLDNLLMILEGDPKETASDVFEKLIFEESN